MKIIERLLERIAKDDSKQTVTNFRRKTMFLGSF